MSTENEQVDGELEEEFASLEDLNVVEDTSTDVKELDDLDTGEEEQSTLPDKFKDKSIDDVVKSYTELEKEFGRRNNEVGELRKLTDELLNLQLKEQEATKELEYTLDVDSLLDNPNEAISKAVENHPKFKQFEEAQRTETTKQAKAVFEDKHPDWQDLVGDNDFVSWIQESPVRARMFLEANKSYDYELGDELFTNYKAIRGVANSNAEEQKSDKAAKAMKAGAIEKGSGTTAKKKVFRRADLINLKLSDPAKYAALEPEIMKAYAEKRVR